MKAGRPLTARADYEYRSAAEWRESAEAAEQSGDYLSAADAALIGLDQHPADRELAYFAALNLSRAGADARARDIWQRHGLETEFAAAMAPGSREENIAALGARLDRQEAFAAAPHDRPVRLRAAAARYAAIYARTSGSFPGINAAVLYELAGDAVRARALAAGVAAKAEKSPAHDDFAAFQLAADRAAAYLLIERLDDAREALAEAVSVAKSAAAIASTRKQLLRICAHKKIAPEIVSALRNRSVIHFTGHMIAPQGEAGRFPAHEEERVARQIADALAERNVGDGYGSLASGADILTVESLLARRSGAHVVLPFDAPSFREESVHRAGKPWLERFDRCLALVDWRQATDSGYLGDAEIYAFASRLAMGMALLRAEQLATDVYQLAVWDGEETDHPAGTYVDIREWRRLGLPDILIPSGSDKNTTSEAGERAMRPSPRRIRAIMFGDFRGFSTLNDGQILAFYAQVMGHVAEVLSRHDENIATRNTWGDGLYVVFTDLEAAARCALDLQRSLGQLDLRGMGLPNELGLRLGMHAAPVFEVMDPILRALGFAGSHVSRTARLEPATPPGQVYVTEEFAALIALRRTPDLACDYVGLIPAAKGYGRLRMYWLHSQ